MSGRTYVAFSSARRVGHGSLQEVLPALKERFDHDPSELVLVFENETGRQVDFDLRGTIEEVLERASPSRGPGRPKLGVVSREVSLLPRHWEWLEEQPSGASAAIRKLVEQAIKDAPASEQARRIRDALSRVLSAIAGDRPNYEEATRALFAGDTARFDELVRRWPKDVREYALRWIEEASSTEAMAPEAMRAATS